MYQGDDINVLKTLYKIYQGVVYEIVRKNPDLKWQIDGMANHLPSQIELDLKNAASNPEVKKELEEFSIPDAPGSTNSDIHCKVFTFDDALKPLQPIQWVIEPLFSEGSLSALVGCPGSMKTYAMLHAAMCVGAGKNWLDYPTKQSPVLYVDEESGDRRLFSRIQEIKNGGDFPHGIPFIMTSMEGFNFAESEWFQELQNIITNCSIKFAVIDSLVDVMVGVDENSAKETNIIIRRLGKVAKATGCAIVVLHHKNKSGEFRGSTAIQGGVDLMLDLNKNRKDVKLEFSVVKARDIDDQFTLTARPTFVDGKFSMVNTGPLQRTSQTHEDVFEFILSNADSSVNLIMADLMTKPNYALDKPKNAMDGKKQAGRLRERVRSVVNDLVTRNRILRTNQGSNGIEALYSVVDK